MRVETRTDDGSLVQYIQIDLYNQFEQPREMGRPQDDFLTSCYRFRYVDTGVIGTAIVFCGEFQIVSDGHIEPQELLLRVLSEYETFKQEVSEDGE